VLGEVIGQIGCSKAPRNKKLFLVKPILDPIKTHVNRLGLFLLDLSIGKSDCYDEVVDVPFAENSSGQEQGCDIPVFFRFFVTFQSFLRFLILSKIPYFLSIRITH